MNKKCYRIFNKFAVNLVIGMFLHLLLYINLTCLYQRGPQRNEKVYVRFRIFLRTGITKHAYRSFRENSKAGKNSILEIAEDLQYRMLFKDFCRNTPRFLDENNQTRLILVQKLIL